jgi:hypothetical protein
MIRPLWNPWDFPGVVNSEHVDHIFAGTRSYFRLYTITASPCVILERTIGVDFLHHISDSLFKGMRFLDHLPRIAYTNDLSRARMFRAPSSYAYLHAESRLRAEIFEILALYPPLSWEALDAGNEFGILALHYLPHLGSIRICLGESHENPRAAVFGVKELVPPIEYSVSIDDVLTGVRSEIFVGPHLKC